MSFSKQTTRFPAIPEPYWGIVFILFVNSINYYLTYSVIQFNFFFLATYSIDTLQGLLTWYACRWVIFRLDKLLPYGNNFLKRVVVQVLLTAVVALSLITGLTVLTNVLFSDEPIPADFYTYALVIFFIWVLVLNGIYICYHYISLYRALQHQQEAQPAVVAAPVAAQPAAAAEIMAEGAPIPALAAETIAESAPAQAGAVPVEQEQVLLCRLGKQRVLVPFTQVLCAYISEEVVLVVDKNRKTTYVDKSMQELEQLLALHLFRANRQFLLSREAIASFTPLEYGKLLITFTQAFEGRSDTIISRNKAAEFRKWMQQEAALQP